MGKKFFCLSYDDGVSQDREFVKLLNSLGLKCSFNINSGLLGNTGSIVYEDRRSGSPIKRYADHNKIAKEELASLYEGHEVAVHTLHHAALSHCSDEEVLREVIEDKEALYALTGKEPSGIAYPGGSLYDERVIELLKKHTGLKYGRNTNALFFSDLLGGDHTGVKETVAKYGDSVFDLPKDPFEWRPSCHNFYDERFELLDYYASLEREEDSVLTVWGHSYEFQMFPEWMEEQERFFRYAASLDLDFCTFGEVIEYSEKIKK